LWASGVPGVKLIWNNKWRALLLLIVLVAGCLALRSSYPASNSADLNAEIERVRGLARSGDLIAFAKALDQSVIRIPAGEFVMGSNNGRSDEKPEHSVYLDAFDIDRFEVTNAQYRRFLQAEGRTAPPYWTGVEYPIGQADYPVVGVSWEEADAYCAWAGKRLPTEAEWEKTCRGTDGRTYPWGNEWDARRANVETTAPQAWPIDWSVAWKSLQASPIESETHTLKPGGSYPDSASIYGLFDLVGNASEWVEDWYNWSDYQNLPTQNPRSMGPPWNHSLRGSSWFDPYGNTSWTPEMSRCSARNSSHETQDPRVGFRCALSVIP
jgi:formylglycine-generating enzyme required for sulfatase activity